MFSNRHRTIADSDTLGCSLVYREVMAVVVTYYVLQHHLLVIDIDLTCYNLQLRFFAYRKKPSLYTSGYSWYTDLSYGCPHGAAVDAAVHILAALGPGSVLAARV